MQNRYRSQAERQIAGLLDHFSIPFIYEKPTSVVDEGHTKIWYPDFTLARGPIIEYFGLTGNRDYMARTIHKLKVYDQNQFDVLPVYPSDLIDGWERELLDRVDSALENRLTDYRTRFTPY